MKIPFANRTVDVGLPAEEGQAKITVKSFMTDLHEQMQDCFSKLLEACVLLSPRLVRVTCRSPTAMEEFSNLGLTFRDKPLVFRACKSSRWVNITRLSYGVPEEAIKDALRPYGTVLQVKMDTFHNVYVGVRNVLMEISKPIPSRLNIAGHWCHTFHIGQVQTCFYCHRPGHSIRECPVRQAAISAADQVLLHEATGTREVEQSSARPPVSEVSSKPKSYADTVRESEMASGGSSSSDEASDDDSELDAFEEVEEHPPRKRDRSDDESEGSPVHEDKRGKPLPELVSPNLFSSLNDEGASSQLDGNPDNTDTGNDIATTVIDRDNDTVHDTTGDGHGQEDNNNDHIAQDNSNTEPNRDNPGDNEANINNDNDRNNEKDDNPDNDTNKVNDNGNDKDDDNANNCSKVGDNDTEGMAIAEEPAGARRLRVQRKGLGKKSTTAGKGASGRTSSAPIPPNVPRKTKPKTKKSSSRSKDGAALLASFLTSKKMAPAPVFGSSKKA